jgi:diphthamide synthase subunit DPH2
MISTKVITAMQQEYHKITVKNFLLHSTIKVLIPWKNKIYTTSLIPLSCTTFSLPTNNNQFTIILSPCYHHSCIKIIATKNKETFYVSPLRDSPKEKIISINNDTQELGKITAKLSPANYDLALEIFRKQLES